MQAEPPEETESEGAFESDIMLTPEQKAIIEEEIAAAQSGVATRKAHANLALRWPNGVVPYEISSSSKNYNYSTLNGFDNVYIL